MPTNYPNPGTAFKAIQKQRKRTHLSTTYSEMMEAAHSRANPQASHRYGKFSDFVRAMSPHLTMEREGPRFVAVRRTREALRRADWITDTLIDRLRGLIGEELEHVEEPRTARLDARLTSKQRAAIQRAADISGRSVSDFVVHAAHEAALREIEHQVILRLSKRDSETLAAALDAEPSEPTTAFKRSVASRKKILRQSKASEGK